MRLHASQRALGGAKERQGVVLLLSFLVLLVLILILQQIDYSTKTADRVARNEHTLEAMDLAIESTMLSVFDSLKADGEADAGAGDSGAGGAGALGDVLGGGGADASSDALGGEAGGEGGGPSDSHMDDWWGVNRQDFSVMENLRVRVLIQDEDSKFNVLSILADDQDAAERAFERLARVIEFSRKGTEAEIDSSKARNMAEKIREVLENRSNEVLPQPILMTDDEEQEERSLLSSLRELVSVDPNLFDEDLFRDYRDERGEIVHSLGSFLTVWSSLATQDTIGSTSPGASSSADASAGGDGSDPLAQDDSNALGQPDSGASQGAGTGGGAGGGLGGDGTTGPTGLININTAPIAVLAGLLDERDTPYDLWEGVLRYRNERDEDVEDPDEDPPLDEFGEEVVTLKFFDALSELAETDTWNELDPLAQAELEPLLTVQSSVFSIFLTAYKPTGEQQDVQTRVPTREETENEEADGQGLVRTVRAVVWRRDLGEGEIEIVPIVRWEELDYVPFEVLDFPPDEEPSRR